MKRIGGTLSLLVLFLALGAALAACGGSSVTPQPDPEPEAGPGGTAEPGVVTTPPEGATQVQVQLTEWAVVPDKPSVPAGPTYFLAVNSGAETHELVVIKTDLDAANLPTHDDGGVDEDADGVEAIGEIEQFAASSQGSMTFTLEPGSYVLICNVVEEEESGELEAHYQEGMYTAFTVE
jgi:hypothetical protein